VAAERRQTGGLGAGEGKEAEEAAERRDFENSSMDLADPDVCISGTLDSLIRATFGKRFMISCRGLDLVRDDGELASARTKRCSARAFCGGAWEASRLSAVRRFLLSPCQHGGQLTN
jgi:hypothetical protein